MVPFSDFLLEFMDRYGLNNLRESTVEQLEEFISNRNIIPLLGEAPQRCLFYYKSCGKEEAKWQQS